MINKSIHDIDFRLKIKPARQLPGMAGGDLRMNKEDRIKKKNQIRILAIETSCDETSASLIEGACPPAGGFPEIKTNIIASQIDIHKITGGVVPEVAARAHCEAIIPVIEQALGGPIHEKIDSVDAIAVTVGPGLVGSLLVGVETAKALAFAVGKPLIGVNHLEGHIFAALAAKIVASSKYYVLSGGKRNSHNTKYILHNTFPALALVVSGGHTELVLIKNMFDYEIIGQTLDDAAGEAFDKVGTLLGLEYPGGPAISKLAEEFAKNSKLETLNPKQIKSFKLKASNLKIASNLEFRTSSFKLPRPMLHSGDLNFSFSGLKTAVVNLVHSSQFIVDRRGKNHPRTKNLELPTEIKQAIAYEFQEAVVDVLVEKTYQAFILKSKTMPTGRQVLNLKSILLTGGVSANKRLREAFQERFGDKLLISPLELTGDNAGMIGLAAWWRLKVASSKYQVSSRKKDEKILTTNHLLPTTHFAWQNADVNPNLEL